MSSDRKTTPGGRSLSRDVGGTLVAAALVLLGALCWWDTTGMSDPDSYVFPRTVIVLMVAFALLLILRNLLRGGREDRRPTEGSWPRRIGLVAVMLTGVLAMPFVGFLPAGVAVFLALLAIAMFDSWTRYRLIVFPLVGLAIVAGFYVLFSEALLVPLPTGSLFR